MPYHGEAAQVAWAVASDPDPAAAGPLVLEAALPMAGLEVRRTAPLAEGRGGGPKGEVSDVSGASSSSPPFFLGSTLQWGRI